MRHYINFISQSQNSFPDFTALRITQLPRAALKFGKKAHPKKSSSNDFSKLLGGTGGGCCVPLEAFPLESLPALGTFSAVPLTRGCSPLDLPPDDVSGTCRMSRRLYCDRYIEISVCNPHNESVFRFRYISPLSSRSWHLPPSTSKLDTREQQRICKHYIHPLLLYLIQLDSHFS